MLRHLTKDRASNDPDAKDNGDLLRQMGFTSATILVVANMIGTGIYTTSGFIMGELQNPLILLVCWLCGGLFALCGALCYGELGARLPRAGGEYAYLRQSFGEMMGFLSGWISLIVGFSAPIAAGAIAFATYFFPILGLDPGSGILLELRGVPVATVSPISLTAVAVVIVFSLLHYHSLLTGSRVQNVLTVFNFVLILFFVIAGFALGNGSMAHFRPIPGLAGFSAETFAVSLIFVSFAYSGWNAAAYLGAEIKTPQRSIPLSLLTGTLLVTTLYLLLNAVYVYSMPPAHMEGVLDVGTQSARSLFGLQFSRLVGIVIGSGILSAVSAMTMTGPRVYYAMAKDGVFFSALAQVHPQRHTPALSIVLQAAIACVLILTATFATLLMYIGFTLSVFALLTVIGMMRLRHRQPAATLPYRTAGYPVTPLLFIAGHLWIFYYMIRSRPVSAVYGALTIAAGIVAYLVFTRTQHHRNAATG